MDENFFNAHRRKNTIHSALVDKKQIKEDKRLKVNSQLLHTILLTNKKLLKLGYTSSVTPNPNIQIGDFLYKIGHTILQGIMKKILNPKYS